MFKKNNYYSDWVEFRKLPDLMEVDFHWSEEGAQGHYRENMDAVRKVVLQSLVQAQEQGKQFVLFTHGQSTSHSGKTTSRSQVRGLMRSKEATPYIIRSQSIEHSSVFVAAIRPRIGTSTTTQTVELPISDSMED